ncbi:MAG: DUF3365 domain-containing protein [Pseudomonadota bacterium]
MTRWRARPMIGASALSAGLCLVGCGTEPAVDGDARALDEAQVIARAQPIAAEFQATLQAQLKAALEAGGPQQAVAVCHEAAPAIAAMQSEQSGALVRRIADRNRNPDNAVPAELRAAYDTLAREPVIDAKPASTLAQIGEGSGARVHYLSAIPMREQPCSTCHGRAIAPELKTQINALYPADAATGFAPGDLRGALVITWPLSAFKG